MVPTHVSCDRIAPPMTLRSILLSMLWLALAAAPASAQLTGWATPHVGGLAGGDTTASGPVLGVSLDVFEVHSWLGAELDVARAMSFNDEGIGDSRLTTVSISAIAAPHQARLQPYVLGGLGLMRAEGCVLACTAEFAETVATATLGGGLQVRLADWVGIRGDLRYVRALGDHDALPRTSDSAFDFYRASVGVTFIWAQM